MTDREELARFLHGDRLAFERIVERHQTPLLRFAAHRIGNVPSAEDVVQETFLRLLREAKGLAEHDHLGPWLFHVCRNLCLDHTRTEIRMQQRLHRVAVPDLDGREPVGLELEEERGKVRQLLEQLPDSEREILILKVLDGKSYREIQSELGLSLHEVFTTAHRALRKLADGLRAAGLA